MGTVPERGAAGLGIADAPPPRTRGQAPVAEWPLEVLVLQVLACGEEAGQETHTDALVAQGLGTVVPFASALRDPPRAAARYAALQGAAQRGPAGLPLLIAADQEGGRVCRLPLAATTMPGAMALCAAGDTELTRQAGQATAGQLRAVGVNWDLAPVCDLWAADNPALGSRCFAADPLAVARFAAAYVQGLRDGGVAACAKHFPGHGATVVDSHAALPRLDSALAGLRAREWLPFAHLIGVGVEAVMTGHLVVPAWGPVPASLSEAAVRALRDELAFEGVIVTDALGMGGCLAFAGSVGEAAVRALAAGADIALVGHGPVEQLEARDALLTAARTGRLPRERLVAAAARIVAFKRALDLGRRAAPDPEAVPHLLDRPADVALAARIAALAVTPLTGAGPQRLDPAVVGGEAISGPSRPDTLGFSAETPRALVAAARARWPGAGIVPRDGGRWLTVGAHAHALAGLPIPKPLPEGRVLLAYDGLPASLDALLTAAAGGPAPGRLPA